MWHGFCFRAMPKRCRAFFGAIPPLLRSSGNSNVQSDVIINFSLDTSVENTNSPDSDQGEFPEAIQNFTDSGNPDTHLSPLSFQSGDLRASTLTTDPNTGNFPGLRHSTPKMSLPRTWITIIQVQLCLLLVGCSTAKAKSLSSLLRQVPLVWGLLLLPALNGETAEALSV